MLQPGATLNNGQYVIIRLIGQGGFSFVYLAKDVPMAEQVAVKELIPTLVNDPSALQRFVNEARGSRQLAHQNIVRTYNFFQEQSNYYTVMEYVAGGSLEDKILTYGTAPVDQVARLGIEIAEGLQCAARSSDRPL